MTEDHGVVPTDDELLAFARSLLGGIGEDFRNEGALRETLAMQRDLWVMLYQASQQET